MNFDIFDENPDYVATQKRVLDFIKKSKTPQTYREINVAVGKLDFVWDAIQALLFAGHIEDVGSMMISRFQFKKTKTKPKRESKKCSACKEEKPLIEFYQEWSGSPSKKCKECKIASVQKRGPKAKVAKG